MVLERHRLEATGRPGAFSDDLLDEIIAAVQTGI
jgi:hypothetical protein